MVTRSPQLKELSLADADKLIRKALKMKDAHNKYEMLLECVKMMKMLLNIEEVTVIL
jgi:hypothetical protein